MAKVKLKLWKHKDEKKDGYPITYYIRYAAKPYHKYTGYYSHEKHWSEVNSNVRGSHPKGVRLQNILEESATDLQKRLTECERAGMSFKVAWDSDLKQLHSFTEHLEVMKERMLAAKDVGNWQVYDTQGKWLHDWMGKDEIAFAELNHLTLSKLVAYCEGLGNSYSTISLRLRTLNAVWNDAARQWPDELLHNPFNGLLKGRRKVAGKPKDKHQSIDDIKKLMAYKPLNKAQQRAVDMWLLAFMLRGVGIVDLLYLKKEQWQGDYLEVKRLKMPKKDIVVEVKMLPAMREIVERWHKDYNPYVFDLVKVPRNDATMRATDEREMPEGTRQYESARNTVDKTLKRISKNIGLTLNLSMVQARHSWIVAARDLGISKEVVEKCVGHQGQSVMDRHYWGEYDQQVLDEANEQVIALLDC